MYDAAILKRLAKFGELAPAAREASSPSTR
jgi:hypothetical protein